MRSKTRRATPTRTASAPMIIPAIAPPLRDLELWLEPFRLEIPGLVVVVLGSATVVLEPVAVAAAAPAVNESVNDVLILRSISGVYLTHG
jgi:hypothetical protein